MQEFRYAAPTTLREAIGLMANSGAKIRPLAGGTDLIVQLREGLRKAEWVVDVKRIPELMQVDFSLEKGLALGGAVSCHSVYNNPDILRHYPGLADAARIIGGWQIQSRASIGGNVCNSSPAADSLPALMAYDAVCRILGPQGERRVPVNQFCLAPGKNVLQAGELLVGLELPPPKARSGGAYQRFIPRNEMDIAVVGVGCWLQLSSDGKVIDDARIALGAVAPTPVVATSASEHLIGRSPTAENFASAGEESKRHASPISDIRGTSEFRLHLVGVMVARTLEAAVARARS